MTGRALDPVAGHDRATIAWPLAGRTPASAPRSRSSRALWSLPTIGLLVSSFRDAGSTWRDRLVGGAPPSLRGRGAVDAGRTTKRCSAPRAWRGVHQQPHRDHPGHGHPDHDRGVRGVRLRLDALPGRALLFAIVVGLLVVPLQMALVPILRLYGAWTSTGRSSGSGWRIPPSACRWRSSCSTTSSASCRGTCWSRPASTARPI